MKKIGWLILNTVTFLATLYANYYVNARAGDGETIGDISDRFLTYVTPADYAFAIWGLIYLGLLVFLAFQWYQYLTGREDQLREIGIWFAVANIANALWVFTWISLMTDTSVIIMFLLLLSLLQLVIRLRLEIWDAPVRIIAAVWWPIVLYFGWIILASVVNVSAWLVSEGWDGGPLSGEFWAIIMLLIATGIYLWMIFSRNLREAALVGVWGISSIAVRLWAETPEVAWTCVVCCIILAAAAGYHGYRNQETSPFRKIQRGEI